MFDHGYALLIGVDQNKIADLALPTVSKDVRKLNEVIIHPDRCGYCENHVRVLTGEQANRSNIINGLDWLKESLVSDKDANQTAFIYYSGHGHRDESGASFLIPYDFRFPVGVSALAAKDFAAIVQEMSPRRLMVVLDCCHAEAMGIKEVPGHTITTAALAPDTPDIAVLAKGEGRAILSSSRNDQRSWIRKDGQMSVFTYHLIEALTGHIDRPNEPDVLVTEVMNYVARRVPATARTEWKADQEPSFQMSGTAFPIALVLGGKGIQKGEAAPDPLVKLPLVIKSQMDVDTVEGEATNVEIGQLTGGEIDANMKVRIVKKGGKAIGVNLGSVGATQTNISEPVQNESHAKSFRNSTKKRRVRDSSTLLPSEAAAPPQGIDRNISTTKEDATSIRYPSIELSGDVVPRNKVVLTIDLGRDRDEFTDTAAMVLRIQSNWTQLPVHVRIIAPDLIFAENEGEGQVLIRNGRDSLPLRREAQIVENLGERDHIEIRTTFHYNGRMCGSARRTFLVKQAVTIPTRFRANAGGPSGLAAGAAVAPATVTAAKGIAGALQQWSRQHRSTKLGTIIPEPKSSPQSIEITRGTCLLDPSAAPPKLTIEMFRVESAEGMFQWHLDCPDQVRLDCILPQRLVGEVNLDMSAAEYVAELFANCEKQVAPNHMPFFQGLGEKLWQKTPLCFQQTYWSMVDKYGVGFPIQIMSDDPYVPWELMRPIRPHDEGSPAAFLGVAHPLARWYMDDEGRSGRRSMLPKGIVLTTAPDYGDRADLSPLPAAQIESQAIVDKLSPSAMSVAGRKATILKALQDDANQDICLFHFAGHGGCETTKEDFARIYLEDEDLQVFEVRRAETQLGRHRHTVVFFNACQVAQSGLNMGVIGGFAEAFMQRDFGGFIAPLWAVYDDSAAAVSVKFIEEVLDKGTPFSVALREIREKYGAACPTFLSYLYYGDVMAKFV